MSAGWLAENQRLLLAHLERIRALLGRDDGPIADPEMPPALGSLCLAFSLSRFERDVILLCAAVELDASLAARCGEAQGDASRIQPTFGLALSALPEPEWAALCPSAPLRRHRLVTLSGGTGLCWGTLRVEERVLHYLVGLSHLDERLAGFFRRAPAPGALLPSHQALAARIARQWSQPADPALIQLCGPDAQGAQAVAAAGCAAIGLGLYTVQAADLPAGAAEREALRTLWERDARLEQSALLVCLDEHDDHEATRAARAFVEGARGPTLLSCREPLRTSRPDGARLWVERPTMAEQRALWLESLGPRAPQIDGQLDRLVSHFNVGSPVIRSVVARASSSDDDLGAALWDACREEARPQLDDLAQRIDARAGWDDLVLPAAQTQILREIAAQQRQRATVYEAWGFSEKSARGLGVTALFCGPSGTGKTMAAEVLARELRLDLYRIDLSRVVSKYIGETEKNLRRVFDAAEHGGAVLLFDEADALFGKRSEVKDSHDRHANIEVSYLLQRMEAYRGLAILTTNMKKALDSAFLRRLRFVVELPFPGEDQREAIWRRAFPAATPTESLDARRLARVPMTGGNIRNVALNAAFRAADAGAPVSMRHVAAAVRSELAKLEKPVDEREIGGWT